ncbi:MAG: hypothetical protein H6553_02820 [Chitinophagales bacterium]|nr:hypothetical protein [Chitinophagales bacterium]
MKEKRYYIVKQIKTTLIAVLISIAFNGIAQTTQIQFGQNRVQYQKFNWRYLEDEDFNIYFYDGGKEIADFVLSTATDEISYLDDALDFHFKSKVDILVYNNIEDLAQTNIGLGSEVFNIGGTSKLYDRKIFVYFDGNHQHLKDDLQEALTHLYLRQMMSGESFGQMIQNYIFLNLPEWFGNGLAAYVANHWNSTTDDELRWYFEQNKNTNFNKFSRTNNTLAGQSIWNMIAEEYGVAAIADILYLTRVNHNANTGMRMTIGKTIDQLIDAWQPYYQNRFTNDAKNRNDFASLNSIKLNKRPIQKISNLVVNNNNELLAYAKFKDGAFKVVVQNINNKKSNKIAKGGYKAEQFPYDYNYPVLAWSKDNTTLISILKKRKHLKLYTYDANSKKTNKVTLDKFQSVYGADFTNNKSFVVLSAQNKGQTDLYLYNISSGSVQQITNDIYDDLYPKVIQYGDETGILFSSNRTKTINGESNYATITNNLDLYYYNYQSENPAFISITATPEANEIASGMYNNEYYTYNSDENGIYNQYVGTIDSYTLKDSSENEKQILKGNNFPITNFNHNILSLNANKNSSYYYINNYNKKRSKSYLYQKSNLDATAVVDLKNFGLSKTTLLTNEITNQSTTKIDNTESITTNKANNEISTDSFYNSSYNYTFQTPYNNTIFNNENIAQNDSVTHDKVNIDFNTNEDLPDFVTDFVNKKNNPTNIKNSKIKSYKAKFTTDYFAAQLDNSIMTQFYQSYNTHLGNYNFNELSINANIGISDIMENHRISGGFRIPLIGLLDFSGTELFLKYENLTRRVDQSLLFYRRSELIYYEFGDQLLDYEAPYSAKPKTHLLEYGLSFPFDITKSLKFYATYRNDRLNFNFINDATINLEDINENWLSGRLEFVHDNAKEIQYNIYNGFRYKIYAEYFRNINDKNSNIYNIGFDFRHYQKIARNLIWANRIAGASSFGDQRILYFMGGVDSWLNQKYDYSIPTDETRNYGMQAPVTNMRGLPRNIRNGNNYLLWNSEIRFPVFSFFAKKPLKSAFLKDFQLIGFYDAGIAYTHNNPFDKNNAVREEQVNSDDNPIVIKVNYYRNPFVFGYGGGLRTNVLGYFIRLDVGWGFDGLELLKKPIWNFSLSKDF